MSKRRHATAPRSANAASGGDAPLLTYSLGSSPATVKVSPSAASPAFADFTVVISCPLAAKSVTVAEILVRIPVQNQNPNAPLEASALAAVPPLMSAVTVSSSSAETWAVTTLGAAGVFVFKPKTGQIAISTQALTLTFSGIQISTLVGTALIEIKEWAAPGKGTPPDPSKAPASGVANIPVAKFPADFFAMNFTAGVADVATGETVTLSWTASQNTKCMLSYGEVKPFDVSAKRSWPSPPLYETTVFLLHVSTTQDGQTVGLDLPPVPVQVSAPKVIDFHAEPAEVAYKQSVVLKWRVAGADGAYLVTGQKSRQRLPPVSDDANPQMLTPEYGTTYELVAYKTDKSGHEALSAPDPLVFTFLPLGIDFKADPDVIDAAQPSATLTWNVRNATAVTLDGQTVDPAGSRPVSPENDTTYRLTAAWVDGAVTPSTVDVKIGKVQLRAVDVMGGSWESGVGEGGQPYLTHFDISATFHVDHASDVQISNAKILLRFFTYPDDPDVEYAPSQAQITRIGPSEFRYAAILSNPPMWPSPHGAPGKAASYWPVSFGLAFDYVLVGFRSPNSTGSYRGFSP